MQEVQPETDFEFILSSRPTDRGSITSHNILLLGRDGRSWGDQGNRRFEETEDVE